MSYKKFIRYGNNLEVYEYEREPISREQRANRKPKDNAYNKKLGADRKDTLSERQLGQRQNNSKRAMVAFRRLVASNLQRPELPSLLTLTYAENLTDLSIGYKDYRSFVQALRYKYGKDFRYICVPEFQKRGAVHFHALFWGLPSEVFLQERKSRTIAMMWGHGYIFMKETDGHEKLSTYLAKYMSKAFIDPKLKNQKSYVASRNVKRPQVGRGIAPMWAVIDDFTGDQEVEVVEKTYDTKWLGKCRHRLFKITK